MRTNFVVASAACVAAIAGWWVRGIEWSPIDSAPVAVVERASIREPAAKLPAIGNRAMASHQSHSSRNLFAYREAPPPMPVQRIAYVAPPPVVIVREPQPAPVEESKPRLRFTSRFIGRFGPDRDPIAAFTRDGQIVTVRIGERVDENFVLRRIGLESVDVESRDGVEQVPLG
jgi:hypothetical protein